MVEAWSAPQEMPKDAIRPRATCNSSQREEKTFDFCAKTYIAAQAPGWKSGKHAKQWTSSLKRYAYPVIGNLHVSAIGTAGPIVVTGTSLMPSTVAISDAARRRPQTAPLWLPSAPHIAR
jgi:hypothetical protein